MRAPRKVNDSPSQEPGSQLSTSKSNWVTILNDVYSVFTRYFLFFSSPSLSSPVTMELLLTCSVQSYSAEIEDMPFCFFCYDRNQKEKEKEKRTDPEDHYGVLAVVAVVAMVAVVAVAW